MLVALAAVVLVVSAPLRRAAGARSEPARPPAIADLEAAKEAKYREIRDAALDHETGKLSDEDFAALDSTLRAEAVAILKQLDEARG